MWNFQGRVVQTLFLLPEHHITSVKKHAQQHKQPTNIDYNKLKPYFGWVYTEAIKKTFENSTQ